MPPHPKLLHEALSEQIIGASMVVLNALGPGLDEKIYERALVIELTERGIVVDAQHEFPVYFKNQHIGSLVPDLIVEGKLIIDTKVVEAFHENHIAKVLAHLAITTLELGILVNFKYPRLQWKRLVRTTVATGDRPNSEQPGRTADDADKR